MCDDAGVNTPAALCSTYNYVQYIMLENGNQPLLVCVFTRLYFLLLFWRILFLFIKKKVCCKTECHVTLAVAARISRLPCLLIALFSLVVEKSYVVLYGHMVHRLVV